MMRDETYDKETYTVGDTVTEIFTSDVVRRNSTGIIGTGRVRLSSSAETTKSRSSSTTQQTLTSITDEFDINNHHQQPTTRRFFYDFDELLGEHVVPMLSNDLKTLQALVIARPGLVDRKFLTHEVVIKCAVNDLSRLNKLSRSLLNLHRQGLTDEPPILLQSYYSEKLDELLWDLKQSSGDIFIPSPSRLLRLLLSDECERCPRRHRGFGSPLLDVDVVGRRKNCCHVHFEFGVQICLDCSRTKLHLQEINNKRYHNRNGIYREDGDDDDDDDDDDEYGCYKGTRFYNRLEQYFGGRFMFKSPQYDIQTNEPIGPVITLETPIDQIQETLEDVNNITCPFDDENRQRHLYQKNGSKLWRLYQKESSALRHMQLMQHAYIQQHQ